MANKKACFGIFIIVMLAVGASAQDTSLVGIVEGNIITYKLIENTVTDAEGEISPFTLGSSGLGKVEVGETFDIQIDTIEGSNYDYTATAPDDTDLTGSESMAEIGSYAIHTDWDHWSVETNLEGSTFEGLGGDFEGTDGDSTFTIDYFVEAFIINITFTLEYDKETGVMNEMDVTYDLADFDENFELVYAGSETLLIERDGDIQTAEGGLLPFPTAIVVFTFVLLPILSRLRFRK